MSSKFSLQRPYVVATLPKPVDREKGRYVVGDVYGGAAGAKKRKRSELAVGIDGEGVNLYDITSSRLITSYALPPQSTFTCAPNSLRTRISKTQAERRTYASTSGTQSQITLFRDVTEGFNTTITSTTSHNIGKASNPVVFMSTTTGTPDIIPSPIDLIVVKKDGEIQCLDGESLQEKWTSPASALIFGESGSKKDVEIEFTHLTNAHAVAQGIFEGREDIFAMYPQEISENGFNPDILVLISKTQGYPFTRRLHIVAFPRKPLNHASGLQQSVHCVLFAKFQSQFVGGETTFQIHVSGGTLQQLSNGALTTYNLTEAGPKEQSKFSITNSHSFLRLSSTSIMSSSQTDLSVFNFKYQSILAKTDSTPASEKDSLKRKRGEENGVHELPKSSCRLITYFPKLSAAVGIVDSNLVAIQVEGHLDRQGRSRAAGLLIDSLGCSIRQQEQRPSKANESLNKLGSQTISSYLPSSINTPSSQWAEQARSLETAFYADDLTKFDGLIANKLRIKPDERTDGSESLTNGKLPQMPTKKNTSHVDRRWPIYTLGKIFTWDKTESGEDQLSISFLPPIAFSWLLQAGYVTVANIESGLKTNSRYSPDIFPAGALVNSIVEINPDMDMLLALIGNNYLGAAELVCAIRILMQSLEMLGEKLPSEQGLLTIGEDVDLEIGDIEEQLKELETETENDLELAEYQLGQGASIRGQALSLALSKLYTCPASSIIYALQTTLSIQEIVGLIHLLRFELARGAWTSRYLDVEQSEIFGPDTETPGNAIILISSLLNSCIDAVGAGGWLSGEASLLRGDPFEAEELIASLKLEVSAALEGIEEATYLKGLILEMVRYGNAVQAALPKIHSRESELVNGVPTSKKQKAASKPFILPPNNLESRLLPLGLKAEQQISLLKVGAGGEISERTARDIGNLKSRRVGKYSYERIVI